MGTSTTIGLYKPTAGSETSWGGLVNNNTDVLNLALEQGWILESATLTYASSSTFTVSGDLTTRYRAETKIKLTQTSVKYFKVLSSSYSAGSGITTVTVTGYGTYTVANAVITSPYFSYFQKPYEWPITEGFCIRSGDPATFDFGYGKWLTVDSSWHVLDISSIVPDGAKAVLLRVKLNDSAVGSAFGVRATGSGNTYAAGYAITRVADIVDYQDLWVALDNSRTFEYIVSSVVWTTLEVTIAAYIN